jgi:putative DNA primase/helicase
MIAKLNDIIKLQERIDREHACESVRIELRAGELAAAVEQAETALIAANAGIYQRGGQLVRVAQLDTASTAGGIKRAIGTPVIIPVTRDYLRLALAHHVSFMRYDRRRKDMMPVDPPSAVASLLLAAAGSWKFPELRGIVSAPTLRPDGTLISEAGYDSGSGLLLWDDGTPWPIINERPDRTDAVHALELFEDLFQEFEFADGFAGPSAAAAIAATVSTCIRHALPIAPGYGLNAHKQGSGKTTLGHTIARITTGRDAAVMPLADEEGEVRKALLAVLMAADLIVLIDNIKTPVDSGALCAALTSATYKDRVLGESRTVSLPTAATLLFTGNNLEFVGDLTSRILLSTLDPQCEQPERRAFSRDIAAHVSRYRGELVRAALTIPLAYLAAGEPALEAPPSRFAAWDRFVRRPLLWLGCADPLATQAELRGSDPIRAALIAVMTAWREVFGEDSATVAQAISIATAPSMSGNSRLLEAITDVAGERNGSINARRLGRWLVRHLRRIEDGWRFEDAGEDPVTHRRRYRVTGVTGVSGVSANARERDRSVNLFGGHDANAENDGNAVDPCPRCDGEGCKWCTPESSGDRCPESAIGRND